MTRSLTLLLLAASLRAAAPLPTITNVQFREFVDGPIINGEPQYLAGSTAYLDFQISGFKIGEKDLVRSMSLSWSWKALDAEGVEITPGQSGDVETEIRAEDKQWMPKVRIELPIPNSVPSGTCSILIAIQDRQANVAGSGKISIKVGGRTIVPAPQIEIRNLHFYRTEDSPDPLETPAYRIADPIPVKLDLVGFQLGPKNAVGLKMDLLVRADDGKEIISAVDAFDLSKAEAFYPPRYIPAQFSFNLDPGNPKGRYTLVLKAKDTIGGHSDEKSFPFSIE